VDEAEFNDDSHKLLVSGENGTIVPVADSK